MSITILQSIRKEMHFFTFWALFLPESRDICLAKFSTLQIGRRSDDLLPDCHIVEEMTDSFG